MSQKIIQILVACVFSKLMNFEKHIKNSTFRTEWMNSSRLFALCIGEASIQFDERGLRKNLIDFFDEKWRISFFCVNCVVYGFYFSVNLCYYSGKKIPRPKWTIYKYESDKNKCLSVGNFGILFFFFVIISIYPLRNF